eukprot:1145222-Pelagomonas_calceolata.AAC.12
MLVTCHLAAHGEHVERRNADYARIAAGLFKAGAVADAGADATELSADATQHGSMNQFFLRAPGHLPLLDPRAGNSEKDSLYALHEA